jgi:hypothetical protein
MAALPLDEQALFEAAQTGLAGGPNEASAHPQIQE